jgi:hypothetical protein
MDQAERDECIRTSSRVRLPGDAAFHYFLGVLHMATGQPDHAFNEVELAIGLLIRPGDQQADGGQIEVPLRRLRATLLQANRPDEAAVEYATAGRLAFDQGASEVAIDLIECAAALGELDQPSRWILADSHLVTSFVAGEPRGVSVERVNHALNVWQAAFDREPPQRGWEWA